LYKSDLTPQNVLTFFSLSKAIGGIFYPWQWSLISGTRRIRTLKGCQPLITVFPIIVGWFPSSETPPPLQSAFLKVPPRRGTAVPLLPGQRIDLLPPNCTSRNLTWRAFREPHPLPRIRGKREPLIEHFILFRVSEVLGAIRCAFSLWGACLVRIRVPSFAFCASSTVVISSKDSPVTIRITPHFHHPNPYRAPNPPWHSHYPYPTRHRDGSLLAHAASIIPPDVFRGNLKGVRRRLLAKPCGRSSFCVPANKALVVNFFVFTWPDSWQVLFCPVR